jgi:Flp pilus assembly protein TadG
MVEACLRKFTANVQGTVAVIFAVTATVVIGAAGMAIDFINASGVRSSLQNSLDGAVLAAAASHVKSEQEAETVIAEYMNSNWSMKYPSLDPQISQTFTDDAVSGTAIVTVPTLVSGVLGFKQMEVRADSTATISNSTLEIAMVIDNSSSMLPHLATLKNALESVVDIVSTQSDSAEISYAVVPYSVYTNVGTSNATASWLSIAAGDVATWKGCVGSRNYPLDLNDSDSTPIPAVVVSNCNPTALLPLTSDASVAKSWINSLQANVDDTYTGAGLIWGWRVLSEDAPFDEAKPYGESQKVIIFLTDARTSMGPSYPKHTNEDNTGDAIWQTQCTNIKAQDILLYTIAFDTEAERVDQLRDCATSSAHAFVADNASELKDAFESIAKRLATVYLSQ